MASCPVVELTVFGVVGKALINACAPHVPVHRTRRGGCHSALSLYPTVPSGALAGGTRADGFGAGASMTSGGQE